MLSYNNNNNVILEMVILIINQGTNKCTIVQKHVNNVSTNTISFS